VHVTAQFENSLRHVLEKEGRLVIITLPESDLITIFARYDLFDKEFSERVFEISQSNELSDHAQERLHGFGKHLSQDIDCLEFRFTRDHDLK